MNKRTSGVLLHITSLPGKYGIGDFGPEAYRFADFLSKAKQSYWQILPLNPPHSRVGISPYNCLSAFAGNTSLISPELLCESGYIKKSDIANSSGFSENVLDYKKAESFRVEIFNKLFKSDKLKKESKAFEKFCMDNKNWLDDYALFLSLSKHYKTADWSKWPKPIRDRKSAALKKAKELVKTDYEKEKILQYIFFKQWFALKKYCNKLGIGIIGDMPIYVAYQSPDVWANPEIFKLDRTKRPAFKSGVPPDFFSKTGQLWGNPVYNWRVLKEKNYHWWIERTKQNLKLYDIFRIDHFRGFAKFWQIPGKDKNAIRGKWTKGPGENFFKVLYKHFPSAQIIAEDLGLITPDVKELLKKLDLPGMKVLHFAFSDTSGKNTYQPHNYIENCIVYTGTHDNNTTMGWFKNDLSSKQKNVLFTYLGHKVSGKDVSWEMIRMAMNSVAKTTIIPMQDLLCLGSEARMNHPAKIRGNWKWRLKQSQINNKLANQLAKITELYGRT
ncbi:MAG: 4-alpha-glucanotransferase [Sedimentisphaerales bacterium]|nr:4-alpha-glucanotransferase [Sedimentisphaerales bacterium]